MITKKQFSQSERDLSKLKQNKSGALSWILKSGYGEATPDITEDNLYSAWKNKLKNKKHSSTYYNNDIIYKEGNNYNWDRTK